MSTTSASVRRVSVSCASFCTWLATMSVEKTGKPFCAFSALSYACLYRPVTRTWSPGATLSMRSKRRTTSLERGTRPAGTDAGGSCRVMRW